MASTKNPQTGSDYLMGYFENLWHFGRTAPSGDLAATQASKSWATSGTSGPCCNNTTTTSNCLMQDELVETDQSHGTGAAPHSVKSNRINQHRQYSAHSNWQQQLQPLFRVLDEDEDGQVSLDEMHSFLRKLGKEQVSRACLVSLIESVSPNCARGGRDAAPLLHEQLAVDFSQFTALYESLFGGAESKWQDPEEDDELLDAFHVYDRNGDGFISASELAAVLVELGLLAAPAAAGRHGKGMAGHVSRCQALIDRVDSDGNGLVDLQEFKAMLMMQHPFRTGPSTSSHEQTSAVAIGLHEV